LQSFFSYDNIGQEEEVKKKELLFSAHILTALLFLVCRGGLYDRNRRQFVRRQAASVVLGRRLF
jgi:hypothetical protein